MAGAAGAVVAADAEVRAYTAAVAYLVAEKRGPAAPFFVCLDALAGIWQPTSARYI